MRGLLALLLVPLVFAQPRQKAFVEQLHFTAEDAVVRNPVAIPDGALDMLRKDDGVMAVMESEAVNGSEALRQWLRASEIHLSGPNEKDLVIVACGPLAGANVTRFWVLRPQ